MIRQNLGYKLFALLAAMALWVYVNPTTSVSLSVPLEVRNRVEGIEVGDLPQRVNVILTGPKQIVEELSPDQVRAYVDLASCTPGVRSKLPIHAALAPDVRERVTAKPTIAQVTTTIEEIISRTFSVEVSFISPEPLGYAQGEPEVLPGSALVTGRRTLVASIKRLVAYVDISGPSKTGAIDRFFPVVAVDRGGRRITGLRIEPREVRVRMQLQQPPAERTLLVSPTIVGLPNPPFHVKDVEVIPPSVTVTGKADRLATIGTLATDPIYISRATASISKTVRIRVPPGVTVTGTKRVQVNILIQQE